ncbi:hypothetical protein DPMN_032443 [Dreissena polymorpha]|uniref:Uncharacterized protein n=1 Tax=Dreissena polymorpha TaxID=45954 RepID=A0A9D4RK92_DREPO|nr:hypothetical protein DPMN_032443 [Dreissena polymorpha]
MFVLQFKRTKLFFKAAQTDNIGALKAAVSREIMFRGRLMVPTGTVKTFPAEDLVASDILDCTSTLMSQACQESPPEKAIFCSTQCLYSSVDTKD